MTLLLGRKYGMTQVFADDGKVQGATVLELGPCVVTQVRTRERDGYDALQLGFGDVPDRAVKKPQRGQFQKTGVAPKRYLREERASAPPSAAVGDQLTVDAFSEGDLVDVVGTTKGRGFAGTIKRHNFSRGPETHGCMNVRQPGSIGSSADPSRVFKGMRMGGHMGMRRHTTKNLRVVRVDRERGLLFVAGAVPGPNGGFIQVRTAKTGIQKKKG